ncbi:MAG TPA: hypothetical protein VHG28_15160 [Longimicrobiaceae bacterium]|nr:hypothetical protein [Longimicrobiaceae bacterium]
MLNETAFADKGNGLRVAISGGIADATLMGVATAFRSAVTRKFRMLPARHIAQTLAGADSVIASVKDDGEGVFVYFDAERDVCVAFNAPSGRARIGLACTEHVKHVLAARGLRRALLCAELYLRSDGGRTRVGDVIHTTSNGTAEERGRLALAFYDAVMLDGRDLRDHQREFARTWDLLGDLFGTDEAGACHRVAGELLPASQVPAWFGAVTGRGLEGIVVRLTESETTYKIKPSLTVDTVAIGYVEGAFEDRYGVLSILCALTGPDGKTLQGLCRVGSGFTDQQRESLLETLSARKMDAPLNMADSDGRPITFVRPGLVIEVEGEALREASLDGTPVVNQKFVWDGAALRFTGVSPSPKLSHATFGCVREDKGWDDGGTRMSQVISESAIARILQPRPRDGGVPGIPFREVYVKQGAVRKIVVIHRDDPRFARFTVFWTDYSPRRQDPLQTETRIAETPERLAEIVGAYRLEAGKRGWSRV